MSARRRSAAHCPSGPGPNITNTSTVSKPVRASRFFVISHVISLTRNHFTGLDILTAGRYRMMQTHYMAQTDYSRQGISPAGRRRGARRSRFITGMMPYFPIKIKYLSLTINFKNGCPVNESRPGAGRQNMSAIEDIRPREPGRATPTTMRRQIHGRFAGPFLLASQR